MIERYTLPEMGRLWSEEAKFQSWLDVEIAATEAAHAIRISLGATTLRIEAAAAMTAGFVRLYAQNQVG